MNSKMKIMLEVIILFTISFLFYLMWYENDYKVNFIVCKRLKIDDASFLFNLIFFIMSIGLSLIMVKIHVIKFTTNNSINKIINVCFVIVLIYISRVISFLFSVVDTLSRMK